MMRGIYIPVILYLLLSGSCSDFIVKPNESNENVEDFNVAWQIIDDVYPFFKFKNINWDSLYPVYQAKAEAALGDEIFTVLLEMIFELKDAHMGMKTKGNVIPVYYQSPRATRDRDSYSPYVVRKYFNKELKITSNKTINYGFITDDIGYIRIASFDKDTYEIYDAISYFLNTKGLIIDVRDNSGGSSDYADDVISRFIDKNKVSPLSFRKNMQPSSYSIRPQNPFYGKPVVVLMNGGTFSSAEGFCKIMENISTVTMIGDTTAGGSANPQWYSLPSGTQIRVSTTCYLKYDGKPVEWNGIFPDIRVVQTKADIGAGNDKQLEYAINYLNTIAP